MRSRIPALVLVVTAAIAGAGCKQRPVTLPSSGAGAGADAGGARVPAEEAGETPETVTDFAEERPTAQDTDDPDIDSLNQQGVLKTVYFEYDQDGLSDTARATLQANSEWLLSHAGYRVRIEGNADERGTIEYNLALGQRRADSVREYLGSLGVSTADLEVTSFGEEKPVADGASEASWSQNRRADFVILSKP